MDETILDKLSRLTKDNHDYECVFTVDELNILQNKINLIINGKPKRVIQKKKSLVAVKNTRKKKLPPTE